MDIALPKQSHRLAVIHHGAKFRKSLCEICGKVVSKLKEHVQIHASVNGNKPYLRVWHAFPAVGSFQSARAHPLQKRDISMQKV